MAGLGELRGGEWAPRRRKVGAGGGSAGSPGSRPERSLRGAERGSFIPATAMALAAPRRPLSLRFRPSVLAVPFEGHRRLRPESLPALLDGLAPLGPAEPTPPPQSPFRTPPSCPLGVLHLSPPPWPPGRPPVRNCDRVGPPAPWALSPEAAPRTGREVGEAAVLAHGLAERHLWGTWGATGPREACWDDTVLIGAHFSPVFIEHLPRILATRCPGHPTVTPASRSREQTQT